MATSCSPALKGEEQPRARSTVGLVRDLGTRPPATVTASSVLPPPREGAVAVPRPKSPQ